MISIVVPTRKPIHKLRVFLEQFQSISSPSFELILVLNSSAPFDMNRNGYQSAFEYRLRVLTTQIGVNRARNLGVRNASGEIIFLMDDDCFLPSKNFLSTIQLLHASHPHVFAFGGNYMENAMPSTIERVYSKIQNEWIHSQFLVENGNHYQLLGGNFSFKKSMLGNLRFNEEIPYGSSECSFFIDANNLGLICRLEPSHGIFHYCEVNVFSLITKAYAQGRWLPHSPTPLRGRIGSRISSEEGFLFRWYQVIYRVAFNSGLKKKINPNPIRLIFRTLIVSFYHGILFPAINTYYWKNHDSA